MARTHCLGRRELGRWNSCRCLTRPDFFGAEKGGVVQLSSMQRRMCASGAQGQGGERMSKRGRSGAGQGVRGLPLVGVGMGVVVRWVVGVVGECWG